MKYALILKLLTEEQMHKFHSYFSLSHRELKSTKFRPRHNLGKNNENDEVSPLPLSSQFFQKWLVDLLLGR